MGHFFGNNLKHLRTARGLSQKQFGEEMGKGQKTISNWESGFSEPSLPELVFISNFFQIDFDTLIKHTLSPVKANFVSIDLNFSTIKSNHGFPKTGIESLRKLWKEELSAVLHTHNHANWQDEYIKMLETKINESLASRISHSAIQMMTTQLLDMCNMVMSLADEDTQCQ